MGRGFWSLKTKVSIAAKMASAESASPSATCTVHNHEHFHYSHGKLTCLWITWIRNYSFLYIPLCSPWYHEYKALMNWIVPALAMCHVHPGSPTLIRQGGKKESLGNTFNPGTKKGEQNKKKTDLRTTKNSTPIFFCGGTVFIPDWWFLRSRPLISSQKWSSPQKTRIQNYILRFMLLSDKKGIIA